MTDLGWSRYIASQDAAADMEMAADAKLGKLIADEGIRGVLERVSRELSAEIGSANVESLALFLWAASGDYCIRHANRQFWHPTSTGGLCSLDETCPTCQYEPLPAPGHGCVACSYFAPGAN